MNIQDIQLVKQLRGTDHITGIQLEANTLEVTFNNSGTIFSVPMNEENSDYKQILEWEAEGAITIQEAD